MALAWAKLLKPSTVFSFENDSLHSVENDQLLVLIGGFVFLTFFPLGLATLYIILEPLICHNKASATSSLTLSPSTFKNISRGTLVAVLYLLLVALACTSFASVWSNPAGAYFMADSPFNLLSMDVARVNHHFEFKLYKDVAVYYSVLGALVLVGSLAHFVPSVRHTLAHRVPILRFRHSRTGFQRFLSETFPRYISIGELLALAMLFGLAGYWLYFWRWDYSHLTSQIESQGRPSICCASNNGTTTTTPGTTTTDLITTSDTCSTGPDPNGDLQIWARVLGHMTTFFVSLTLYPVARNSIWEAVFGIPYERAVKVVEL